MSQLQPNCRLTGEMAMRHKFFQDLPGQLYNIPDGMVHSSEINICLNLMSLRCSFLDVSIFTVPGVCLSTEERKFPPAVLRVAQELKNKKY